MLSISEIVAKTETMFDLFNAHFYDGELARPAITVSPDGGRGAYGWCTVYEIWQADGQAYREINICAEYINRPISEVAGTMLHEMAHLYNLNHGIKDVSNNGYYHNKKFKETAAWIAQQPELSDITANRQATIRIKSKGEGEGDDDGETTTTTKGGRSTSKNRSIKYVCPKCGAIIRATKLVNVVCGGCDVAFEIA